MHSRTPFRLLVVSALYAVLLGMLAVLWRLRPRIWWVAISRIFAAHLFWPLLLLVPAALGSRSRVARALVALPVVLFGAMFGRRFLPRFRQAKVGQQFRVATFNVNFRNQDASAIVAAIRALEADAVALQELTPQVAMVVACELHEFFPYQLLAPAEKQHGLGMLSRFPLAHTRDEPGFRGQRATINLGERTLTFINAHPTIADIRWQSLFGRIGMPVGYEPGLRAEQIAALAHTVDAIEGDLVVAGDFNTAEGESVHGEIAARMRDAFIEAGYGFGFTFPVNARRFFRLPLVRIDYVWYRGALHARSARVTRANGNSDHRIVVADLELR